MEHPDITHAMRTGYAPWQRPEEDSSEEDLSCRRWDQKTVQEMMEEVDYILQRILADDLRSEVWNKLAEKFTTEEDKRE